MNALPRSPPRPLSAWTTDSDERVYVCGLPEAVSAGTVPIINRSPELLDPPASLADIKRESDERDNATEPTPCRVHEGPPCAGERRQAPHGHGTKHQVNSVEVVKNSGVYSVVIDGVSQGEISRKYGPSDAPRFQGVHYWLPRFKESTVQTADGDRRIVQPIVFSLRVEDFDSVPRRCTVHVQQSVMQDGTVITDRQDVKVEHVKPYSTGGVTADVVVLPYAIIAMPAPHFHINDYSPVSDAEGRVKRATELTNTQKIAKAVDGLTSWFSVSNNKRLAHIGHWMWDSMFSSRDGGHLINGAERDKHLKQHHNECHRKPVQYKISVYDLPKVLRRIAATRSNGSLVKGTNQTIGWSAHDLHDKKWHKEAALFQWLMYGEGTRYNDTTNANVRPNEFTGQYTVKQQQEHHDRLVKDAHGAGWTGNTISRVGMDTFTLSNTRAELSYTIRIVEHDGRTGPEIHLGATRMNGIDAGLISVGYDDAINKVKEEMTRLNEQLNSMPKNSELNPKSNAGDHVRVDTNTGYDYGHVGDQRTRDAALLDDEMFDQGQADNNLLRLEVNNALEMSENQTKAAEEARRRIDQKLVANDNEVWSLRNITNVTEKEEKTAKVANDKLKLIQEEEMVTLQESKARDAKRLARGREWEITQGMRLVPAHIIDTDAFMNRLNDELLGKPYEEYGTAVMEGERKKLDSATPVPWKTAVHKHRDLCMQALCLSLSVDRSTVQEKGAWLLRFTEAYSPAVIRDGDGKSSQKRRPGALRLASFKVPKPLTGHAPSSAAAIPLNSDASSSGSDLVATQPSDGHNTIVRMLPQIVDSSSRNVSSFGYSKIVHPKKLASVSEEIDDQARARGAITQLDRAIVDFSKLHDPTKLIIWDNRCHSVQLYTGPLPTAEFVVHTNSAPIDMVAMSALPSRGTISDLRTAAEAGGATLEMLMGVAAGTARRGVGKLLQELGCAQDQSGVLAIATFSEVLALHVLEHGAGSVDGSPGLGLQRRELTANVNDAARRAVATIANFVMAHYASTAKRPRRMAVDDVAFFCMPGMPYLRVALRRLGFLEGPQRCGFIFAELNSRDVAFARSFCKSLLRLATHQRTNLAALPFSCVQSVLGSVPVAVRWHSEYADAASAQVHALVHSYDRVCTITKGVGNAMSNFSATALCTDCICSRPIVLKMAKFHPTHTANVVFEASRKDRQQGWKRPSTALSRLLLQHRLASLRINIGDTTLHELVPTPTAPLPHSESQPPSPDLTGPPFKGGKASPSTSPPVFDRGPDMSVRGVYASLVEKMTQLHARGLAELDREHPVASYMVPFGTFDVGSVADVAHMNFEMRPVWVSALRNVASTLHEFSTGRLTHDPRTMTVRLEGAIVGGRPRHPFILNAHKTHVSVYVDGSADIASFKCPVQTAQETPDNYTETLLRAINAINTDRAVSTRSGKLAEVYRATMHNSERLLQACLLIGAELHDPAVASPPAAKHGHVIHVTDENQKLSCTQLAVAMCVSNAMATVALRVPLRITTDAAVPQVAPVAAAVVRACDALERRNIAAVPFAELCACLSCVRG